MPQEEKMKKAVYMILLAGLAIMVISAPAWAKKAGEVKDGKYIDGDYKFSFTVPDGWGVDIKQSKSPLRLVMTQNQAPIPQHFLNGGEDYAQTPTMVVFADTTSLTAEQFLNALNDSNVKSEQKKFFLQKLTIITKPHDVLKEKDITIAGIPAKVGEYKQLYQVDVSVRGTDKSNQVTNYKGGSIFIGVKNNMVYLFYIIFEYQYNNQYIGIFNAILGTLKIE